jgi:hypothetical protein
MLKAINTGNSYTKGGNEVIIASAATSEAEGIIMDFI